MRDRGIIPGMVATLAGLIGTPAVGQQMAPEPFVGVLDACLTWIIEGAPDDFAVDGLDAVLSFPTVNETSGSAVGSYAANGFTLTVLRSDDAVLCNATGAGPDPSAAEPFVNAWLGERIGMGVLAPVSDPTFEAPFAICTEAGGSANIFAGNRGVNFTMSGGPMALPEGACG